MKVAISINILLKLRTGVEEYIFNLLQNIPTIDGFKDHHFFLLTPSAIEGLPPELSIKILKWPFKKFWTQIRLSWEMFRNKYDVLFVPAHIHPIINKKIKLIVTIQGLEFEKLPRLYPFLKRKISRWVTKSNAKRANKIIVPSKSTKDDLIKYYHVNPDKIVIIHHGANEPSKEIENSKLKIENYLLYLGRRDKRKNVRGLINAFKILKQEHNIPHKLVLAGPNIGYKISKSLQKEIICTGYVSGSKKWGLLKNADVFVFPSFYEGFGMPILEAQKVGTPVVCSSTSSMPELVWNPANKEPSAILVNPYKTKDIVEGIHQIVRNQQFADELVKRGYENVQRFSWHKCAEETLNLIISN